VGGCEATNSDVSVTAANNVGGIRGEKL
jgi:hypothetical protein